MIAPNEKWWEAPRCCSNERCWKRMELVNSLEFIGLVSHLTMAMQFLVRQPQRLDHFPAVRQEAHWRDERIPREAGQAAWEPAPPAAGRSPTSPARAGTSAGTQLWTKVWSTERRFVFLGSDSSLILHTVLFFTSSLAPAWARGRLFYQRRRTSSLPSQFFVLCRSLF